MLKSIGTSFVRAKCESIFDSTFDSAIPANLVADFWPRCSAVRQHSDAVRQHWGAVRQQASPEMNPGPESLGTGIELSTAISKY